MAYEFIISPDAKKQLRELEPSIARRIVKKLTWISQQDYPLRFAMPLHHFSIGDIRFRIGDYRVIADVDEKKKKIAVVSVGHRRDIYR
ncbi:MAG: type II toxin-antitoxin system RelE/ParE family toxin [Patescibacteria group bacterium]